MKNVWKGLVVGAITGAGIGSILDMAAKGSATAIRLKNSVRRIAPEVAHEVKAKSRQLADHADELPHAGGELAHEAADRAQHLWHQGASALHARMAARS